MNSANLVSKILSIMSVLILICNIVFSGYIVSLHKNEIDERRFTISQALAFGNEIALVVLIVISLLMFGYLVYYRSGTKMVNGRKKHDINLNTIIRLFLIFLAGIFLITIVWITTFRHEQQHYIFASIIFTCATIFIILNSVSLWKGKSIKKLYEKIIIITIPILSILAITGAGIGLLLSKNKDMHTVFPIFENIGVSILGASILSLGFI